MAGLKNASSPPAAESGPAAAAELAVAGTVAALAACGAKHKAAATLASVGTAAAVAPCGSLIRDGLRWRPKGLLPEQFALTPGTCTRGALAVPAWSAGPEQPKQGWADCLREITKIGQIGSRSAKVPRHCPLTGPNAAAAPPATAVRSQIMRHMSKDRRPVCTVPAPIATATVHIGSLGLARLAAGRSKCQLGHTRASPARISWIRDQRLGARLPARRWGADPANSDR
jgi:hypothetical protein